MTTLTDDECGFCGASMRGEPIQQRYIDEGFYEPGLTHYSRLIGVEYSVIHPAHFDGVSEWLCPDCGVRVGRWSGRVLVGDDYERRFGAVTPA